MRFDKSGVVMVFLALGSGIEAGEVAEMPWQPGYTYATEIRVELSLTNCVIDAGVDKPYEAPDAAQVTNKSGAALVSFEVPEIKFMPVIRYTTEDVVVNGNYYCAKRYYEQPLNFLDPDNKPAPKFVWKKDVKWYDVIGHVSGWYNRVKWWGKKKDLDGAIKADSFNIFDIGDQEGPHLTDEEALFIEWTDRTYSDYLRDENSQDFKVSFGKRSESTNEFLDRRREGLVIDAGDAVRSVLQSELNLSLTSLLDDPQPRPWIPRLWRWDIDFSSLRGLLASRQLQDMIDFSGKLKVVKSRMGTNEVANTYEDFEGDSFDALVLDGVDSKNARVGFRRRNRTSCEAGGHKVRITRDGANQVRFLLEVDGDRVVGVRYAEVVLCVKDYKGDIPNPNLGKVLSKISGTMQGDLKLKCKMVVHRSKTLKE